MRTTLRILLLALLAFGTALILSCSGGPPAVSISDTISSFVSSLNGNRSNTYTYTDPNASNYNAAKTPSFWNAVFLTGGGPYAIPSSYDTSNPSSVIVTLNGNGSSYGTYKFVMVNDKNAGSDDWLINGIFTSPGGSPVF